MVTNFLCLLLLLLLVSSVSFLFTFITVVVMCDCYLEWHADGGSSPGLLLPSGGNQLHRSHQCTLSLSGEALDLPHQSMLLGVILRLACMLGLGFRTANPARLAQSRSHIVSMVNRMLAVSNVSAVFCKLSWAEITKGAWAAVMRHALCLGFLGSVCLSMRPEEPTARW